MGQPTRPPMPGCTGDLRRPVLSLQLPGLVLPSHVTRRCLKRRFGPRCAAIGWSEAFSGGWADPEPIPIVVDPSVHNSHGSQSAAGSGASHSQHHHAQQPHTRHQHSQLDPARLHHQQQQHHHHQNLRSYAAQHVAQRLVPPPTSVASATHVPLRSGASAAGVALGVLLTVALQMVGRWVARQAWGRALLELMDLRRSSGSSASTSGGAGGGGAAAAAGDGNRNRPGELRGWGKGSGADGSDGGSSVDSVDGGARGRPGAGAGAGTGPGPGTDGVVAAAAAVGGLPFVMGGTPGSPLSTLDGVGAFPQPPGMAAAAAGGGGAAAAGAPSGLVPTAAAAGGGAGGGAGSDPGESVEWVNMCWRKVWRVYQRGLERWIIDLLQPVFDGLVKDGAVPRWLCRLRVVELTLDHEAPYFSNMRRRNSRKDSDLNGVVDLRYTGGARMLLLLELGEGRWRFKVPVLVSDLDLECQMWLKLRLAPMCPWIGTISLAFVGPPNVKVQLSPYNRVRLMRVPVVQNYLRKLLTVDLPGLMVLPQRLEINIPPSVTTIAEAAVGRDTIMRAVASAVLQADAVEAALLAALPLGPQTPAGGVTLPEAFKGELSVALREARNLPVWGFPGQSNPYCRLVLGEQAVQSRREGDTSHPGRHRAPVWNQEFQFLVEDPTTQVLEMLVKDSHLTGRTEVGRASLRLADLIQAQSCAEGGKVAMWVPLQPPAASYGITGGEAVPTGEVLVELSYKPFDDDEQDSGCREAENYLKQAAAQAPITDIRSAAAASSRAAVAASAAVSAIAMTKAAAARAAARAARAAQEAAAAAAGAAKGAVDQGASIIGGGGGGASPSAGKAAAAPLAALPPGREVKQLPVSSTATAAAAATPRMPESAAGESPIDAARTNAAAAADAAAVAATAAAAGALGGGGEVRTAEAGAGAPSHAVEGAGAAARRLRVVVSEGVGRSDDDDGDGDGGGAVGGVEEARSGARAAAVVASSSSAAATASAPAAAVPRSATAAAVLERPAQLSEREVVVIGGDGEVGTSYGRGGGGEVRLTSWHEAPVSPGDGRGDGAARNGGGGGDGALGRHVPATSWRADESNGHGGADGGSGGGGADGAAHVSAVGPSQHHALKVRLMEEEVQSPQSDQPASQPQHHVEGKSVDIFDVTAELVPPPAAAPPPPPTGHTAGGGGGGGGGPVLSALASWTASAQSLTASAVEKARESLGQRSSPEKDKDKATEQQGASGGAADGGGGEQAGGADWLKAIVSLLPRYGGGPGAANHHDDSGPSGGAAGGGADRPDGGKAAGEAAKAKAGADDSGGGGAAGDEHPWWQFWVPKGGAAKLRDAPHDAAADGAAEASAAAEPPPPPSTAAAADGGRPWWQFWGDGGEKASPAKRKARGGAAAGAEGDGDGEGEGEGRDERDDGSKPVEAIYIPPDLPLEEIAAEVARLKEDSWRERSDHVSSLWMKAVERNDRKWLMLAAFLLSVAVGLLTVVAWRLEHLEQMEKLQAVAPQIALMTMQAALEALLRHTGGADGSGML